MRKSTRTPRRYAGRDARRYRLQSLVRPWHGFARTRRRDGIRPRWRTDRACRPAGALRQCVLWGAPGAIGRSWRPTVLRAPWSTHRARAVLRLRCRRMRQTAGVHPPASYCESFPVRATVVSSAWSSVLPLKSLTRLLTRTRAHRRRATGLPPDDRHRVAAILRAMASRNAVGMPSSLT